MLLKYGSDININSAGYLTRSCLCFAVDFCDEPMVDLLLKNGASVNFRIPQTGESVLEKACNLDKSEIAYKLLRHGADLDISEDNPWFYNRIGLINFSKELSKLVFEGRPFCSKNLEYMQSDTFLKEIYLNCLKELQKMKNLEICDGFSLYDLFKVRKNCKRMILLLKNQELVDAFKSLNLSDHYHWGEETKYFFKKALEKTEILQCQEKKLYEADLDKQFSLPSEIIERIAYFANTDLF